MPESVLEVTRAIAVSQDDEIERCFIESHEIPPTQHAALTTDLADLRAYFETARLDAPTIDLHTRLAALDDNAPAALDAAMRPFNGRNIDLSALPALSTDLDALLAAITAGSALLPLSADLDAAKTATPKWFQKALEVVAEYVGLPGAAGGGLAVVLTGVWMRIRSNRKKRAGK